MPSPLQQVWSHRGWGAWALRPVSWLYGAVVALRRALYRTGVLRAHRLSVPVIVVGNVIAGGAGKTPVTQAVVRHLQAAGWQPGIVSRGYGRQTTDCRAVLPDSSAADVGDEPALLARSTGAPVFVAARRAEAAHALLAAQPAVNVIVCDDGLQHLALARDIELCVFNDEGIGNGWLLPAGPLREPWPRPVDAVLHAGPRPTGGDAPAFALQRGLAADAVQADGCRVPLSSLLGQPLHAIAAIARPHDFFSMLRAQGLTVEHAEALPDHYDFNSWKRLSDKRYRLICTEKDAIKLWPNYPDALAVPLALRLPPEFFTTLDAQLARANSQLSSAAAA
ncbi:MULTISPECIES: tetraacyldisaccharide 4'-kinase [unclassified Acidovorax]|uniref:tetraacyldisaccharide 4'-kinase n=1 Tax=unclassified Acidovorax TaxID=2684926 RepID=UPI002883141B|nr:MULTISPECIES: tetraacyldisaccharide 4'-kinase [unclassified Acidovorax]